tara:strand:- start:2699 stop:3157 length:459 start_codon:yes stop_codon:yes gene_type:complete
MNMKIVIGGVAGLLLLVVAVFFILDSQGYFIQEEVVEEEEAPKVDVGNAFYVPMPKAFIFNLNDGDRVRTVQISVQLVVRGAESERIALNNIPLLENALLNEFSSAEYKDLLTQAGRQELNSNSLRATQSVMKKVMGDKVITQVLFTGFVIQ